MAIYRARISFSGAISMGKGEERDIISGAIAKDLLDAGYIEYVSGEEPALEAAAEEPTEETAEAAHEEVTEEPAEETAEAAHEEVTEEPAEETAEEPAPEEGKAEKKKGKK